MSIAQASGLFSLLICLNLPLVTQARGTTATEKALPGNWQGALNVGVVKLRLVFHFEKNKEGKLTGSMDSIDQGAKKIKIDTIQLKEDGIFLEWKQLKATYDAKLGKDGKKLEGTFKQAGLDLKLTMEKTDKLPKLVRPQEPKGPFPYLSEEVTFDNKSAGIKLAGTLTLPKGEGPFPAVVLITGSGPQNRNEELFGHKMFFVIADYLTRKGIAVLRHDDRGVGKSTGDFNKANTADFATDTQSAVDYLISRKVIDHKKIGLLGHSEGGLIAPMVAAKSRDIAFIILLAGPGFTGEEILFQQGQAILKAMGADEKQMKLQRALQQKLFALARKNLAKDKMEEELKKIEEELKEHLPKDKKDELKNLGKELGKLTNPWFRYFMDYDPRPTLKKVQCPVLALNGQLDTQVIPRENLGQIKKALQEGGNKDITIQELAKLNHLFQTASTGAVTEYGTIEETIAPAALNAISEWILERVKK